MVESGFCDGELENLRPDLEEICNLWVKTPIATECPSTRVALSNTPSRSRPQRIQAAVHVLIGRNGAFKGLPVASQMDRAKHGPHAYCTGPQHPGLRQTFPEVYHQGISGLCQVISFEAHFILCGTLCGTQEDSLKAIVSTEPESAHAQHELLPFCRNNTPAGVPT